MSARFGWLCVLSCIAAAMLGAGCSASFDPEVGRKYPCSPQDGGANECPDGFRCGLEGFCRDPAEGGAFRCRDDADCPQVPGEDWHCGIPNGPDNDQRCYERESAQDIPCRYDAGFDDCASGWKCGTEGRCHDETPRGYPCFSDVDCEGGWLCSLEGACHDTAAQAIAPSLPLWRLARSRISPALPADPLAFHGLALSSFGDRYTYLSDGGVTLVELSPFGRLNDGGVHFARRFDVAAPPGATSVLLYQTYVGKYRYEPHVTAGGHLFGMYDALAAPQGKVRVLGEMPEQVQRFASVRVDDDLLLGAAAGTVGVYDTQTEVSDVVAVPSDAGLGPVQLTDFEVLDCSSCGGGLLGATAHGLYFAAGGQGAWKDELGALVSAPHFRPVHLPGAPSAACAVDGGTSIGRIRYGGFDTDHGDLLGLELLRADGGAELLLTATGPGAVVIPSASCSNLGMTRSSSCAPCPEGGELVDFRVTTRYVSGGVDDVDADSVCNVDLADGGTAHGVYRSTRSWAADGGCELSYREARLPRVKLRTSGAEPGYSSYLDRSGNPVMCSGGSLTFCYPELLSYRPAVTFGEPDRGTFMGFTPYALNDGGYTAEGWRYEKDIGMTFMSRRYLCLDDNDVLAVVAGSDFVIARDGLGGAVVRDRADLNVSLFDCEELSKPVARLQGANSVALDWPDRVPLFGHVFKVEEGTFLIVAGGDRVWMGDLTARLTGEMVDPVTLPVRLVPLPFARIEEAVFVDRSPLEPKLAAGYLNINGRLFRFEADDPQHLNAKEITVPAPVAGVFADADKARFATTTGEVYALPVPVLLGEGPLGPEDPVLHDAEALCEDVFGVGARGLHRLEPRAGGLARWQPISLPGLVPDDKAIASFAGATLHRTAEGLYVLTQKGIMYRLGYDRCDRVADAMVDAGMAADQDAGAP